MDFKMDVEMDDDLDVEMDRDIIGSELELDPIKEFLLNKLKNIREKNAKMEKDLLKKKQLLDEYLKSASLSSDDVIIEKTWSRVCNDYFVIGLKISNLVKHVSIKISNILLNWNSSLLITYKTNVFKINENGFDTTSINNEINKKGIVILSIEKPNFLKQLLFTLNGILTYKIGDLEYQIKIPEFKIEANDFSDILLEVKMTELLNGNLEDLLAFYSSHARYYLKGEINSFTSREITAIFGIDCMFREISLKDKKLFYIDGISTTLNGSLIEILTTKENKFNFMVLCKNDDVMVQLLHYLYKNIQGIRILPKKNEPDVDSLTLSEALIREISLIEEYYSKDEERKVKEVLEFRRELNQLQYETDFLYCLNNK